MVKEIAVSVVVVVVVAIVVVVVVVVVVVLVVNMFWCIYISLFRIQVPPFKHGGSN